MNHWARPLPTRTVTADEVLDRLAAMKHYGMYENDQIDEDFTVDMSFGDWIDLSIGMTSARLDN